MWADEIPNMRNDEPYFVKTKLQKEALELNRNIMKTLARDEEGMGTKLDESERGGSVVRPLKWLICRL